MKEIELTKGKFTLVDDDDFEKISQYKWYVTKKRDNYYAYRDQMINKKKYHIPLHRFLLNVPENMEVDHINRNGLDNRRENLRVCTQGQNNANRLKYKNNTSGYKGVFWHIKNKYWRTQIVINKKAIHIGVFQDKVDAAKAYNQAALKYFGDFANLNKL